jgi:glutamate-1-semialdehyde 2,1-aminomutase
MTTEPMTPTNAEADFAALRARLHKAIPGGAHTYSRGDDQFPSIAPPVLSRGKGAYVWDTHGNRYLDYGMALRAVTIGYADERVNTAAIRQIENGVNLTRATEIELEAAELICDLIPCAEMVKFGKNGSNVTTAAVKIARAYTGRRYVCVPRQHPFFSFDDWFIGVTAIKRGTLADQAATTLVFDYNDIGSLKALFDKYPDQIAAVMLEPATSITPCGSCPTEAEWPARPCATCPNVRGNFLHQVKALAHGNGALFILDEMITGFRWHLKGAQEFFGIEADLATYGKAMANGFSLAAVVGKREFMEVGSTDKPGMERTFLLSSTHGAEMPALGAFVEATRINATEDVPGHLWAYGARLKAGLAEVAGRHGLADYVFMEGPAIALNYVMRGPDGQPSLPMRTLFAQEMLSRGVMMPWLAISQSHGDQELATTLDAFDGALGVYSQALETGVDSQLKGPAIKPVFRTHN